MYIYIYFVICEKEKKKKGKRNSGVYNIKNVVNSCKIRPYEYRLFCYKNLTINSCVI